jgi:hypothetical protein
MSINRTMFIHPALSIKKTYEISGFREMFGSSLKSHCQILPDEFDDVIMTILLSCSEELVEIDANSFLGWNTKLVEKIYKNGIQSKVGKNSETLLDESIRKSKEYTDIIINPKYLDFLKSHIQTILSIMKAGTLINIKPHKFIIYGQGDYFNEHMDSVHIVGQNMSCVVSFKSHWNSDGFEVNGVKYKSSNNSELFMFYNDVHHKVHKINSGYRCTITFDLIVEPYTYVPMIMSNTISTFISNLKNIGVNRFGFFTCHTYFGNQKLKGYDAKVANIFQEYSDNNPYNDVITYTKLNLTTNDNIKWYDDRVYRIFKMSPGFGSLLHEIEEECENCGCEECECETDECETDECETDECETDECETDECEICKCEKCGCRKCECGKDECENSENVEHSYKHLKKSTNMEFPKSRTDLIEMTPNFICIKDEYRLGDVLVLTSYTKPKHIYRPNEEVHLGNEGFFDNIYENMFILFTYCARNS